MKSRITIEVDFENGNQPVIKIAQYPDSPDVRDRLIKNFLEQMAGSSWCKFEHQQGNPDHNIFFIRPINNDDLIKESEKMLKEGEYCLKWKLEHKANM